MMFHKTLLLVTLFLSANSEYISPYTGYTYTRQRTYVPPSYSTIQLDPDQILAQSTTIKEPTTTTTIDTYSDVIEPVPSTYGSTCDTYSESYIPVGEVYTEDIPVESENYYEGSGYEVYGGETSQIEPVENTENTITYQPIEPQPVESTIKPIVDYDTPTPEPVSLTTTASTYESTEPEVIYQSTYEPSIYPDTSYQTTVYSPTYIPVTTEEIPLYSVENTMLGSDNLILGSYNNGCGDQNIIMGSSNTLSGDYNTCVGNDNLISGDLNDCTGNTNELYGDANLVCGDNNFVSGCNNVVLSMEEPINYY